ncbi:cation transporter [Garciella nitratireducens]|uniref:cation transporter n=1 Tax=Garciella nitratireducens TaxID=218205 RepID=UPI000DEBA9D2|nr:cation transporter [Garciella nitratireducens]RBP40255.1 heavy-metal-associated domain-containing protein [Garciella nitratireducens]
MKKKFKLEGLECANCAAKMEEAMNQLDGVKNASVNFITTKMIIEAQEEKMERIIKEAEEIIKRIEPQVVLKKV